jgi:putative hydrolase of the HAD superfamily
MISHRLEHPQSIRAVFFDVGYTLLAPHPSVVDIAAAVLLASGIGAEVAGGDEATGERMKERIAAELPAAEQTLRQRAREKPWTWSDDATINGLWTEYFGVLLRPLLAELPKEEAASCVHEVARVFDGAASYALYPDALPVLRALHARGLTLGVISDWSIGLGLILRHHDLVQFFDFAVISAAVRLAKPDPALFETALRRADAIGDYALHIGDSYVLDVLGARAAGITPVLLDRARRCDPGLLDCLVVHDLYGLLDLLDAPRPQASPEDGAASV